jgi:hypothetical protein
MLSTLNAQCSVNHKSHSEPIGETFLIARTMRWSSWSLTGLRNCWASTSKTRLFVYGRIDIESCCWSHSLVSPITRASHLIGGHG